MKFTILGTGTAALCRSRACCAYHVVKTGGGVGIDMGAGVLGRYCDAGIDFMELDALVLTHPAHVDHVGDLPMLLFSMNYTPGRIRKRPLPVYVPEGEGGFIKRVFDAFPKSHPKNFEVPVFEVEEKAYNLGGLVFNFVSMTHGTVPAVGVRIEDNGRQVAVTGDTEAGPWVVRLLRDVDLAVMHCAFAEGYGGPETHLNGVSTGRMAAEAQVRRLVVTHRYPLGTDAEVLSQIRQSYGGPVSFAVDLDAHVL